MKLEVLTAEKRDKAFFTDLRWVLKAKSNDPNRTFFKVSVDIENIIATNSYSLHMIPNIKNWAEGFYNVAKNNRNEIILIESKVKNPVKYYDTIDLEPVEKFYMYMDSEPSKSYYRVCKKLQDIMDSDKLLYYDYDLFYDIVDHPGDYEIGFCKQDDGYCHTRFTIDNRTAFLMNKRSSI